MSTLHLLRHTSFEMNWEIYQTFLVIYLDMNSGGELVFLDLFVVSKQ